MILNRKNQGENAEEKVVKFRPLLGGLRRLGDKRTRWYFLLVRSAQTREPAGISSRSHVGEVEWGAHADHNDLQQVSDVPG